jgi:hypothetical protein
MKRKFLGILCFISILVMASECDNLLIFIISHLIACIVLGICAKILLGDYND